MPHGHYWEYIENEQAKQIIHRDEYVSKLRGHYCGWTSVSRFAQVAEMYLWQEIGWTWLDYKKSGRILQQDDADEPQWADVQIDYAIPDTNNLVSQVMRVEVERRLEANVSSGSDKSFAYPQFVVRFMKTV
ncbi:MAG: hypothetical protein AAF846_23060 [Chloroflexota bacterium]